MPTLPVKIGDMVRINRIIDYIGNRSFIGKIGKIIDIELDNVKPVFVVLVDDIGVDGFYLCELVPSN
jgi:hypothetical protein